MSQQQQQREDLGAGVTADTVMNIISAVAYPLLLLGSRFGSVGPRYLGDKRAWVALIMLLFWAGLSNSPALMVVWVVVVLAQLLHRLASRNYQGHSRFVGSSWFSKSNFAFGHLAWGILAIALWFLLYEVDSALAVWFGASGWSTVITIGFMAVREKHTQADTQDALIEAQHRGERMQEWQQNQQVHGGWQ